MDKNKPLSIRKDEFIENVVNCVNTSGLPLWTVSMLLKEIINVVDDKAAEEHQRELDYYNSHKEGAE